MAQEENPRAELEKLETYRLVAIAMGPEGPTCARVGRGGGWARAPTRRTRSRSAWCSWVCSRWSEGTAERAALLPRGRGVERSPCYRSSMSTAKRLHYTYEEYLATLDASRVKLEYCDGVMYAMAGGTIAHAQLAASMIRALGPALPEGCAVFSSDLKVRVEATDLSTFPDVSVVCGPIVAAECDPNAVTNPTILVEVTSRSTEDYDRGEKLSHYKQLASLRAVLFVSHRERRVTVIERAHAGWQEREYRSGEAARVSTVPLELSVDELYRGVALDAR